MREINIGELPTEIIKLQDLRIIRFGMSPMYSDFTENATAACLIGTTCLPCLSAMRSPCLPWAAAALISAMAMSELYKLTFSCCTYGYGMKVPKGIEAMQNLEILMHVDVTRTGSRAIEGLGKLTQLRKLGMIWARMSEKKGKKVCASLEKLTSLRSLSLIADGDGGRIKRNDDRAACWVHSISSPPPLLENLSVVGYIGPILQWVSLLNDLVKVKLFRNGSTASEVVTSLEGLPNLRKLLFSTLHDMSEHDKIVFREKVFPKLLILKFNGLSKSTEVMFERGTAPLMEEASFLYCKSNIHGLTHLPRLKQVTLDAGADDNLRGMIQEQVDAHPNHPALRM
ncbi:hypothetical protein ACP70R_047238 [Stipagrostis hirtigluma subsp. patula]